MKNKEDNPVTKRVLSLQGAENVRELGGYQTQSQQQTKWHKVLRAADLSNLTQDDIQFLTDYGLKTIVDFRSTQEILQAPDPEIEGVKRIFLPVFYEGDLEQAGGPEDLIQQQFALNISPKAVMQKFYKTFVQDEHSIKAYQQFFTLLLEQDQEKEVLLFHCTAGKDRTGFASALFLHALGVDQKTIFEDYLLTNKNLKNIEAKMNEFEIPKDLSQGILEELKDMWRVNASYLEAAFDAIDEEYGSMDQFIKQGIGLNEEDINQLKKIYLH